MATIQEKERVSWKEKEKAIRLLERSGRVNPLELIEEARDPSHPCHDDFTWDVEKAAQERWWDQARALIRQCKFPVTVDDVTEPVVRYVQSDDEDIDFISWPTVKGKESVQARLWSEVSMLHGVASRVYGLAVSKHSVVGNGIVKRLKGVRDDLKAMKEDLS